MEFTSTKIRKGASSSLISQAQLISLYLNAPQEEISLDEFELFALDRLSLLRSIEALKARGFDDNEFKIHMAKLENQYMPLKAKEAVDANGRTQSQRKDQISHFILRLAYCRTEELRRWFISQELLLLKFRLDHLNNTDMGHFMASNGMHYEQVSIEEKKNLEKKLHNLAGVQEVYSTVFYKVPFQEALSLISSRQVFLRGGFAYVPLSKLISVIMIRFRMNLSRSLADAVRHFDYASADNRIGSLLKNMNKQYTGKDFSKAQSTEKLTVENIDTASENNMPLCMKNLHNHLKHEHKLKHWGRLQYGLFLKAAGMDLEDAQRFWESMFTKIMSHDDFNKKYAYNVRHMYGKEGARKNYTPYSCMKIIMGAAPEVGGHHGCPYKHMSENQLTGLLSGLKISNNPSDIAEIVTLAKGGNGHSGQHYGLACQKHFDLTHPDHNKMGINNSDNVAIHPNQWFQSSVQYYNMKVGKTTGVSSSSAGFNSGTKMEVDASAVDVSATEATASMDTGL